MQIMARLIKDVALTIRTARDVDAMTARMLKNYKEQDGNRHGVCWYATLTFNQSHHGFDSRPCHNISRHTDGE